MPTANELFTDFMLSHQIGLLRLSGHIRNEMNRILEATENDLRKQLELRLEKLAEKGFDTGPQTTRRLNALLSAIRDIRKPAWKETRDALRKELLSLALAEPSFVATAMAAALPVVVETLLPSAERLKAIVTETPFEGKLLREWSLGLEQSDLARMSDAIKIGLIQGETSRQITQRIMGSPLLGFKDGTIQQSKRNIDAVVRTAVNHVGNGARGAFFEENAWILNKERYVATLDSRTTVICASLDGKTYPVGEGPKPPMHFRCRSLRVAVIDGTPIGDRPAKRSSAADLKGLSVKDRRAKVREMTGQVPATTTYAEFLKRQSVEFQNEVLGITKARLFRNGGLTLDKFVDRAGNELTLADLMRSEREAFVRAGLLD